MEIIEKGNVVAPKRFMAGAAYCGIKTTENSRDIGIIYSDSPAVAAAVFTTNKVCAAPVHLSRKVIKNGRARAIVVNSGNANACTGERGYRDAEEMLNTTASSLKIPRDEVLVASTGIIGRPLPMDKIISGIKAAAASMGNTTVHGDAIAQAILTTDTRQKDIAVRLNICNKEVIIGGIAKGAGMISPNMATMLCFITTDVSMPSSLLNECLKHAVDVSFNCITIDGHMSTNDTVAIIANGASGVDIYSSGSGAGIFQQGLNYVSSYLAKSIVKDGEGATKFIQIDVTNTLSSEDARRIARSIANSILVKTAIHGEDPNWGRIVSAAGYAGVELDERDLKLFINNILVFAGGMPTQYDNGALINSMKEKDIYIRLDMGLGKHSDTVWTCDLSREYVTINSEYHT